MDIVGAIASVMSCLCGPDCFHRSLANEYTYLKNPSIEIEKLKSNMEELNARVADVNRELHKAKQKKGMDPKEEVNNWLKKVAEVAKDVDNIIEKGEVEKRCLNGLFPNYCSRRNPAKRITKKIKEVNELLGKGQFPNGMVVDLSPDNEMMIPTTTLVGETTAKRNLEIIWTQLINDKVESIGVYGMGGVGKTTIMYHLNNRLVEEKCFTNVIWVTVSKTFHVEKLQNDIAKAVNLVLSDDEDEIRRRSKLFEALKRRRFVLILDDMWEDFPLEKVGIPEPNGTNGCKLVITTRSLEVCRKMGCQQKIKVEVLAEKEAWNLFMNKVGRDMELTPEVEAIAKLVCEECCGLPLAIITVGRAMSGVDNIREWRQALKYLRGSTKEVMGMEEQVFEILKFSYESLKDEKLQKCFLYCALYPEDYNIPANELIGYWIVEGLISDNGSRQEDFDDGQVILNKLKNTCLLEGVYTGRVKMHDLIRDMALNITRLSPRCMIKAGVGLQELPNEEEWTTDLEIVSLMNNDIKILSCKPKCPNLSVLLLKGNRSLGEISDTFFEHMLGLKILDLSYTKIKSLPDSLSNLENLGALILRECKELRKVPSLAKLNKLRELDLSCTSIEEVPRGMEKLVKLKRLDLSRMEGGLKMSDGILPQLTSLYELRLERSKWEIGGNEELLNLKKLEIIYVEFCSLSAYNSYVRSLQMPSLHEFHLHLNRNYLGFPERSRAVRLCAFEVKGEATPFVIPGNTLELSIWECHDVTRLSQFCFSLKNARELNVVCISKCEGLECIISAQEDKEGKDEEDEENFLQSVEKLQLWRLDNLRSICKDIVPRGFLSSLKILEIKSCNKMKNLFPHGMLQHNNLQNLEEIIVRECMEMEEMIGSRGEEEKEIMGDEGNSINANSIITLPKLKRLWLRYLPKLKSIYRGALFSNSLESIVVLKCPELRRLPIIIVVENENTPPQLSTPALKIISGSEQWWDSVQWDQPNAKTLLQPFHHQRTAVHT